jgi:carboxypeptidase family protein/TonB-dependent receptor-like protein
MRAIALAVLVLFLGSFLSFAQTDATVSGTVTDPTGAHVVEVKVTALNIATGIVTMTRTNEAGVFVFPALQPGMYRFTAEHSGFHNAVANDVALEVGSKLTLNLPLELGTTTESVEVQGVASMVNTSNATVGDVINGKKLLDLPLAGRSSYDLIITQPGVIQGGGYNINGNRGGAVNFTTDGINSVDNLLPGSFQLYSNLVSVDRAEEFRVVTSPADAELGRGVGQIQMITRSGTNSYHGSLWEEFRNTDLNANDFFNNLNGTPRNVLHQNQYGVRMGGPVRRNRTFFNGIYEGQRQRQVIATTQTVYTQTARNGIFRFFPGQVNGNAIAAVPTVDLQGNPVAPTPGAQLQSINVFGRDPNRLAADPTGIISKQLGLLPLPNNFRSGDGLNTAGFTWSRPFPTDNALYEGRVDHMFNDKHRLSIVLNHQAYNSFNVAFPQNFPTVPGSPDPTETTQYSAAFTSVIRPSLLNEARFGAFRPRTLVLTPQDAQPELLPTTAGGVPYILAFTGNVTSPFPSALGGASNRISPVYQYSDTLTWVRGKHSFRGGVEVRFVSDPGYDAFGARPGASSGAGIVPVQNISTITGIGANSGTAQNLLLDLAGSLTTAFQTNNSPGGPNPVFLPGQTRYRNWRQREFSGFFKDDFKVTPSFTLNVGLRYEWYGVPTEQQGKMLAPVGGSAGLFGISGTSFATGEFQPGVLTGSQTRVQLIGPGSPNPDTRLYNRDNNNFAPAVGFAWTLPWFGKDKTVIRAGYGIGYERLPLYMTHNNSGLEPGLSEFDSIIPTALLTVGNLVLPVRPVGAPLTPVPVYGGPRNQPFYAFDSNLRTPYYQNYNFSIQRSLSDSTTLTLSYVGSKGTKLTRSVDINEVNVFENGILQAFRIVQGGGTSPLIEQIFGAGGSAAIRTNSSTQGFLANNNVGGFGNYINTTTQFSAGVPGGLIQKANLPANFVVANPQFSTVYLTGNYANSTYNSMQVAVNRRFAKGFLIGGSYVFSKALGEEEGDSSTQQVDYRTLRNGHIDKRRLSFDRTHVFKINGIYELPFGRGKTIGRGANGFVDRIIGGWQIGGIFNKYSGQPLTFSAQNTVNNFSLPSGSLNQFTPVVLGSLPSGDVQRVGNGVIYFAGVKQVLDPSIASLASGLQSLSSLRAIADANGSPILVNPGAGQFGTLGEAVITGPGTFRFDVNLIKRIKVTERITAQIGATAQNLTNTEQFGNPNTSINSLNFGRITGSAPFSNAGVGSSSPARIVVLQARITF